MPIYTSASPMPPLHESAQYVTEYDMPQTFKVGTKTTEPLVLPGQLLGHLKLLHLFFAMRQKVEEGDTRFPDLARQMSPEKRWAWFVSLAVERFERWCGAITPTNIESYCLPPVDVIMVWHAYLLNPGWYTEDTNRVPQLIALSAFNGYMAMDMPTVDILVPDDPAQQRTSYWETSTSTPYDPFDSAQALTHRSIVCPGCLSPLSAPFLNESGSGYAQMNFKLVCTCGHSVTKDTLGLHKFARNLLSTSNNEKYFAGSLYYAESTFDTVRATTARIRILNIANLKINAATDIVKVKDNDRLQQYLATQMKLRLANRIAIAYTDDRLFSIDLVGAVLRQASFVKKLVDLEWTSPAYFSSDAHSQLLVNSIMKYHAFIGLMASLPSEFFVPTLDIDLVWHTHQLKAIKYLADCRRLVGRCVDHNDKVDEGKLSDAFDSTSRAWNTQYGVPYMQCGCSPPKDTIGQKLRRVLSTTALRKNVRISKPQADLEERAATHPSDHNAVHIMVNGASPPKTKTKSNNSTHEQAFHPAELAGVSASNTGGCVSDSHHTVDKSHGSACAVVCNIA
ncbi:hypothetical protein DFH29DRAFT_895981 [Suillus ampliporus]|nr:hypothetical protein DFH29DRAFT_895981 [Suillus ampliporus]